MSQSIPETVERPASPPSAPLNGSPAGDKPRFPREVGLQVAAELCAALKSSCERLIVAGSLRRQKPTIGDIEILYIGKAAVRRVKDDFFATYTANLADETIEALERGGIVVRRTNLNGWQMYGPKNKLMRHKATGLPVDFFSATEANWWNYLVCRTGPADSNTRICMVAQDRGWKWNPYGAGFSRGGELREMASEEAVFAFVGLPYAQPKDRR